MICLYVLIYVLVTFLEYLSKWHDSSFNKSIHLHGQLLFGFGDTVKKASNDLTREINSRYNKNVEINDKRIRLKCREIQHRLELAAEEQLGNLRLPIKSHDLQKHVKDILTNKLSEFSSQVLKLTDHKMMDSYAQQLEETISVIGERYILKNREEFEKLVSSAVASATELFREKTR